MPQPTFCFPILIWNMKLIARLFPTSNAVCGVFVQHLDAAGRSRMLAVLRALGAGSVLVVSQANGELAGMFDLVDTVVRDARTASVVCT